MENIHEAMNRNKRPVLINDFIRKNKTAKCFEKCSIACSIGEINDSVICDAKNDKIIYDSKNALRAAFALTL